MYQAKHDQKLWIVYSYFEKGCWKKCTRQSRKVMRVGLSSLFFTEIWKNDRRGHGRLFASAKGEQQKNFWQLQCQEQCIDHIKYYSFGIIASTFLPTAFLEIAVYAVLSECLFWHSKRTGLVRDSTRLIVSAALLRNDIPERNNKPVSGHKKGLLLFYGWLRGRNSWRSLRPPPNPLCPS